MAPESRPSSPQSFWLSQRSRRPPRHLSGPIARISAHRERSHSRPVISTSPYSVPEDPTPRRAAASCFIRSIVLLDQILPYTPTPSTQLGLGPFYATSSSSEREKGRERGMLFKPRARGNTPDGGGYWSRSSPTKKTPLPKKKKKTTTMTMTMKTTTTTCPVELK